MGRCVKVLLFLGGSQGQLLRNVEIWKGTERGDCLFGVSTPESGSGGQEHANTSNEVVF